MSSEPGDREKDYQVLVDSVPKPQRQRIEQLFGILDRLNEAGIDIGAGYRLEHPFTRTSRHTSPTVRSRAQNPLERKAAT